MRKTTALDAIGSIIQSQDALQKAIIDGAQGYLDAVHGKNTPAAAKANTLKTSNIHGKIGEQRAQHLLQLTPQQNDLVSLFALLYATMGPCDTLLKLIFESHSEWLAACISNAIILGDEFICTTEIVAEEYESVALSSTIITETELESAKNDRDCYVDVSINNTFVLHFQKASAIRSALSNAHRKITGTEKIQFDEQVRFFKSQFKKPFSASEETEMRPR